VTSGFKLLVRRFDQVAAMQFAAVQPVNTFSAPTGVAAAKSACATSFTGAPRRWSNSSTAAASTRTSSADGLRPYQLAFSRSPQ
jgi:hypothetical protein